MPEAPIALTETDAPWSDGVSVLTAVMLNAYATRKTLEEIFAPCRAWLDLLKGEAQRIEGALWVEGTHIDSIWSNAYIAEAQCRIIDREWVWHERIRLNSLVIRAIYDFLCRIETRSRWAKSLTAWRGRAQIHAIASALGVSLSAADFADFVRIEATISECVSGTPAKLEAARIRWFLAHRPTRRAFRRVLPIVRDLSSRIRAHLPLGRPLSMR